MKTWSWKPVLSKYSSNMQDVYKDIEEYIPSRKCIVLLAFDDIIANMISNKKPNLKVTELFNRGRKPNISFVFITHSYFKVPKDARLNRKKEKKKKKRAMYCKTIFDFSNWYYSCIR